MNNKSTKTEIKEYIFQRNLKLVQIIEALNNYGIKTTPQALTNKLTRDTIRYSEVKAIADILDYELVWQPKTKIDENILLELERNNMDINLFEGIISNILDLANPLNNNKKNNLKTLSLILENKELNNSLVNIFKYLSANYKNLRKIMIRTDGNEPLFGNPFEDDNKIFKEE
ncbi:hypothetical protein FDA33_00950 [Clostridium botulinum]|nr:hypothetical protein [Clostridium botulinum]NFI19638.1 hypothetical protein [Clostridium botulinum]NFL92076.1 hypothetical protein [Clostridium botulinum]NFN50326.1 hypothetical protein [Clostridium botulinum]NFO25928.1 hypothetical protein [Clostridium botulinum]